MRLPGNITLEAFRAVSILAAVRIEAADAQGRERLAPRHKERGAVATPRTSEASYRASAGACDAADSCDDMLGGW
jgi:hypothetical protein